MSIFQLGNEDNSWNLRNLKLDSVKLVRDQRSFSGVDAKRGSSGVDAKHGSSGDRDDWSTSTNLVAETLLWEWHSTHTLTVNNIL